MIIYEFNKGVKVKKTKKEEVFGKRMFCRSFQ